MYILPLRLFIHNEYRAQSVRYLVLDFTFAQGCLIRQYIDMGVEL